MPFFVIGFLWSAFTELTGCASAVFWGSHFCAVFVGSRTNEDTILNFVLRDDVVVVRGRAWGLIHLIQRAHVGVESNTIHAVLCLDQGGVELAVTTVGCNR